MTTPITIDSHNLRERLSSAAPPRILDVRTAGEFETAHIAGAYNVPLDLLREHREEIIKHLDDEVVLVCPPGQRAAQAEETLRVRAGQRAHPRRRDHRVGGEGLRGRSCPTTAEPPATPRASWRSSWARRDETIPSGVYPGG